MALVIFPRGHHHSTKLMIPICSSYGHMLRRFVARRTAPTAAHASLTLLRTPRHQPLPIEQSAGWWHEGHSRYCRTTNPQSFQKKQLCLLACGSVASTEERRLALDRRPKHRSVVSAPWDDRELGFHEPVWQDYKDCSRLFRMWCVLTCQTMTADVRRLYSSKQW